MNPFRQIRNTIHPMLSSEGPSQDKSERIHSCPSIHSLTCPKPCWGAVLGKLSPREQHKSCRVKRVWEAEKQFVSFSDLFDSKPAIDELRPQLVVF